MTLSNAADCFSHGLGGGEGGIRPPLTQFSHLTAGRWSVYGAYKGNPYHPFLSVFVFLLEEKGISTVSGPRVVVCLFVLHRASD